MVKVKLTNGEIVELKKDCNCITHEGPHWLHMDHTSQLLNLDILLQGGQFAHIGYGREEITRLNEKVRQMKLHNIEEFVEDTSPILAKVKEKQKQVETKFEDTTNDA